MSKDSGKWLTEKPVVIVRKKAGARSSSTGPTQTLPRVAASIPKTSVLANSLLRPPEPLPPASLQAPPAPAVIEAGQSKKEREKQARRELLEVLRDRWPQAFPRDYRQVRPLAIGIGKDIAAYLPEQPLRRISTTIGIFQHLTGPAYYRAVLQGGPRYDLEGNPRGEVTLKEQEQARRDLHACFEQRKKLKGSSTPHSRRESEAEGQGGAGRED